MIPLEKVKDIILKHNNLEKELSSGNIEPKMFAKKSKEYSNLGNIISTAKEYLNFEEEKRGLEQILNDKNNDIEIIEMAKKDLGEMENKKNLYENRFLNYEVEYNSKEIGLGKWLSNEIKTEISFAFESKNFKAEKENVQYKYFDSFFNLKYDNRDIFRNPSKGTFFSSSFEHLAGYDSKNFQTLIWDQSLSYYIF